jgi:Family of unknown function (DUF6010)
MNGFHVFDGVFAISFVAALIGGSALFEEPNRRNFNAILVGGAGAAYLSGGGLGVWEILFTAVMAYCAFRGLRSYRFIGLAWLLHAAWDVVHHILGHPIIPLVPNSSAGCAASDVLLAIWFLADAPMPFRWKRSVPAR